MPSLLLRERPQCTGRYGPLSDGFYSTLLKVDPINLPHTYKNGCPVSVDELTEVRFTHIDSSGLEALGAIIVNAAIAEPLVKVLETAYQVQFPIHKAVPIDYEPYFGNDDASMADNNSSGFNYRVIAGTNRVSMHSLGLAVDINPAWNPYLQSDGIWVPNAEYVNRSVASPGMFHPDHPVVQEFVQNGFEWGGSWERPDYHHFEHLGS